jgi:hypothetical protein
LFEKIAEGVEFRMGGVGEGGGCRRHAGDSFRLGAEILPALGIGATSSFGLKFAKRHTSV